MMTKRFGICNPQGCKRLIANSYLVLWFFLQMFVCEFGNYQCLFANYSKVPWLDEYPDAVEWLFEKARPDVASRMVFKMEGSEVINQSDDVASGKSGKGAAKAKAKAKAKAASANPSGIDSYRLCAEEVVSLHTKKSRRVKTFVDVIMGSASYVIFLIDRDFASAAANNLILGCDREEEKRNAMPLQCCLSKLDMLLFGVDLRVVGCGQSNFDRIVIKFHIRATATMFEWLNAEDCICQYAIQFPVVSLSKFPEDWDRCLQEDDWHLFQSHVAFCLHRKV